MRARKLGQLTLVLFCLAVLPIAAAQTQPIPSSPSTQHADALYQAQKWPEAAKAYEAITKAEPDNGRAWLRLGVSLHQSGQYEAAIAAYQQALEKVQGQTKPLAMYNLAGANSRLNNKDKAFEWLTRLSSGGMPPFAAGQLKTDEDFASLRDDPRFTDLLTLADKVLKPCMYAPKSRELDFWVGEWVVTANAGPNAGQRVGTSSVTRVEDGCVILENWAAAGGQSGRSLNFYNPVTNKWRQTYVGNNLGIWEMSGEYKEGAMRYEGELYAGRGGTIMTRMTFFNLGPDNVRQLGENSNDDGKTWAAVWDATYTRKK